ncbi:hypothetical protein K493DRAFT_303627 [Basidiobolus meristosporus CBS 931.73]|uniref:Arrestin C-terminal-like domain-containing protein n=1 Tax=Basidiobolus meristosporus CBS 931.73 TaxID=1314790 RepID=A0A1Y1Y209_9FUNG|nr:hypothetical protein K493DRAFT_303627 [Basidiobolus meristosporus CBS 931.73]|eukprot:ORX92043.1 hypothetical protein K493DRAFT_303627 [Basidiobolus meristosporus CBS 931.73]
MSNTIEILLDNPYLALYGLSSVSAGKALRGTVIMRLNRVTRVKSLVLNFLGEMDVHWIYSSALLNTKCRFRNLLVDRTLSLLEPGPDYHTLPAGNHRFPFELALPGDMTETISTKVVRCKYLLTAVAEQPRFWNRLETRQEVIIKRFYPHDDDPIVLSEVIPDFMEITVFVNQKVYGLGDIIPVCIQCNPAADHVMTRISSSIKEVVTYRKPKSTKVNTQNRWSPAVFEEKFEPTPAEKTLYIPIHSTRLNSDCLTEVMDTKHEIVIKIEAKLTKGQTTHTANHVLKIPVLILSDAYKKVYEELPAYNPVCGC